MNATSQTDRASQNNEHQHGARLTPVPVKSKAEIVQNVIVATISFIACIMTILFLVMWWVSLKAWPVKGTRITVLLWFISMAVIIILYRYCSHFPSEKIRENIRQQNIRTVQQYYGLVKLQGWDGDSNDNGYDVQYLSDQGYQPAPGGGYLKQAGNKLTYTVGNLYSGRLIIKNNIAILFDSYTGYEVQSNM